jgi:hypothetical protein
MDAKTLNKIFATCIENYHVIDAVDQEMQNPYPDSDILHIVYNKCWIDTVQWHYEDLIRDPGIKPEDGMALKQLIDSSNQRRTDIVEKIDDYFLEKFNFDGKQKGKINTESPAWVIDRLSILSLKLFHMKEQVDRADASKELSEKALSRYRILLEQQNDLSTSFDQLISDYGSGEKVMKVYRQMKLYNDPETNPVLYKK